MKKLILALLLLTGGLVQAQETGIHFEHDLTWDGILAKAKAEKKYIFVDAFTTWCGPCKMMAANIFPLPEVGEYFNANYINVKVQLDTTAKDNDNVKSWYADAHNIQYKYGVRVFPTYLFISPEGKLVHRAVGSSDAPTFIAKAKDALDPSKQYYTLADQYKQGRKDPAFLKALAEAALNAYDQENYPAYANAYLATQSDMLTPDNIRFIQEFTHNSKDQGFGIMAKNQQAFDAVLGDGASSKTLRDILLREKVYPQIFGKNSSNPDWTKIQTSIAADYPALADEVVASAKVVYYNSKGDWPTFTKAVSEYISKYGANSTPEALNSYAWAIFENCDDQACVNQALEWSKKSVELTSNPMFIDTYANLLYKSGNKDLAVEWEEKAINILKEKNEAFAEYQETLDKMKSGKKTWE